MQLNKTYILVFLRLGKLKFRILHNKIFNFLLQKMDGKLKQLASARKILGTKK